MGKKTLIDYVNTNLNKIKEQNSKKTNSETKNTIPPFINHFWDVLNEIMPLNFNDSSDLLSKSLLLQKALDYFIPLLKSHLGKNEVLPIGDQLEIIEEYFKNFFSE